MSGEGETDDNYASNSIVQTKTMNNSQFYQRRNIRHNLKKNQSLSNSKESWKKIRLNEGILIVE